MSANTQSTHKRKPPKTAWKKGQSGNPKGAPKRGESWAELITKYGNMTGAEVATIAGYMAKEFKRLPEGVTLKELVVMRVYGQMINEPSPGLLSAFMDRTDGKVKDTVGNDDTGEFVIRVTHVRSNATRTAPSAADDQGSGAAL
jgi:hypothetical protein